MSTYVIFDGDSDGWAYQYIRGWAANRRLAFTFRDSHDLGSMTARAASEAYVKRHLRERMESSTRVLVIVGEKTKYLYRYVRWEIELAKILDLPIVVANLNKKTEADHDRLPAILRGYCALHIAYRFRAIKHALEIWPREYRSMSIAVKSQGERILDRRTYQSLGITDV